MHFTIAEQLEVVARAFPVRVCRINAVSNKRVDSQTMPPRASTSVQLSQLLFVFWDSMSWCRSFRRFSAKSLADSFAPDSCVVYESRTGQVRRRSVRIFHG